MFRSSFSMCLLFILTLVCTSVKAQEAKHLYRVVGGFSIAVPADFKVSKQGDGGDFVLYDVSANQNKYILSFFVGNFPSRESGFNTEDWQSITISWSNAADGKKWKYNDGYYAQVYVDVSKWSRDGWPNYVHFWYNNNNQEQAELADAIIQSLKPSAP